MAVHNATFSSFSPSVVEIISQDDTTYDEILESMKGNIYAIKSIYLQAGSTEQILNTLGLYKFDSNGNTRAKTVVPSVDPTQYQNALNIDFQNNNYVLNGRTTIDYLLNPMETVNFYIETLVLNNADLLRFDISENMKEFLETHGFFKDMGDKIKLSEYEGE